MLLRQMLIYGSNMLRIADRYNARVAMRAKARMSRYDAEAVAAQWRGCTRVQNMYTRYRRIDASSTAWKR